MPTESTIAGSVIGALSFTLPRGCRVPRLSFPEAMTSFMVAPRSTTASPSRMPARARPSVSNVTSFICLIPFNVVAQHPDSPARVEDIKDAARVLQHFLRRRAGERAALRDDRLRRIRREDRADLLHVARLADVEGAPPAGKPCDVHRVARSSHVRRINFGDRDFLSSASLLLPE